MRSKISWRISLYLPLLHCHWSHLSTGKETSTKWTISCWAPTVCQIPCRHACSVVSDSSRPHGLQPTRLLCPWDFAGKNTRVGCHSLLQGTFSTQGSNLASPALAGISFTIQPPIEGMRRRVTEDEMVGWHYRLNGQESEQTPGGGEGQGSLVCYSPRGRKVSDTTERLYNTTTWEVLPDPI